MSETRIFFGTLEHNGSPSRMTAAKTPVKDQEAWKELDALVQQRTITW
jgi:ribonuclease HI